MNDVVFSAVLIALCCLWGLLWLVISIFRSFRRYDLYIDGAVYHHVRFVEVDRKRHHVTFVDNTGSEFDIVYEHMIMVPLEKE